LQYSWPWFLAHFAIHLTPMPANCAREVSIRPKRPSPQLLLNMRTTAKYLSRRKTLYQPHKLRHSIRRNRLGQKMNMVLIRTDFQKLHLVTLLDFKTHIPQHDVHVLIDHSSTVIGWKNQTVKQYRNVMALVNILTHPTILRRKRRGIESQGIKPQSMGNRTSGRIVFQLVNPCLPLFFKLGVPPRFPPEENGGRNLADLPFFCQAILAQDFPHFFVKQRFLPTSLRILLNLLG